MYRTYYLRPVSSALHYLIQYYAFSNCGNTETTYCFAANTAFEWDDPPVQDDPRLFGMNVAQQAESFAQDMRTRARIYNTDNILVTFGCDFAYSDADINFKNMEKLMTYINGNDTFGNNRSPCIGFLSLSPLTYSQALR